MGFAPTGPPYVSPVLSDRGARTVGCPPTTSLHGLPGRSLCWLDVNLQPGGGTAGTTGRDPQADRAGVLGKPFARWWIRELADHLRRNTSRPITIGREALRCLQGHRRMSVQHTNTWKESPDPAFDAELARIEYAINERPDRTFAFDEFGPLCIRPTAGFCWAERHASGRTDLVSRTSVLSQPAWRIRKRSGCAGSRSTTWTGVQAHCQTLMPGVRENWICPRVPSTATRGQDSAVRGRSAP